MDHAFVENLIDEIARRHETADVFSIAKQSNVSIIYENWHPVTIGEFDVKTSTIRINRRALDAAKDDCKLEREIVAHELGHFFARDFEMNKKTEEAFARLFAVKLLRANEKNGG